GRGFGKLVAQSLRLDDQSLGGLAAGEAVEQVVVGFDRLKRAPERGGAGRIGGIGIIASQRGVEPRRAARAFKSKEQLAFLDGQLIQNRAGCAVIAFECLAVFFELLDALQRTARCKKQAKKYPARDV